MNKILSLSIMFIFCMASISALQLQLLPNGTLIDSNMTNGTFMQIIIVNNTIYLIEETTPEILQNITYENNTYVENFYENITYVNTTCLNCTNTYTTNNSGESNWANFTYTKSEIDTKINEKVNPYMSSSEAYSLFALKGDINNTETIVEKSSSKTLWFLVILAYVIIIGFGIYFIKEN